MGLLKDLTQGLTVVVGYFVGVYTGNWTLFAAGLYGAVQKDQLRKAQNRARDDFNAQLQDRYQMVKSATAVRQVLYGRARVSGPILLAHTTGDLKQFLHLIVAVGGHEFDAIEKILLNNVELPAADPTTGYIRTGDYAPGLSVTVTTDFALAGWPTTSQALTLPIGASDTLTQVVDVLHEYPDDSSSATLYHSVASFSVAGNVVTVNSQPPTVALSLRVVYQVQRLTTTVRVRTVLGTDTQTAFAEAVAETGGKWTSAHRGLGIPMVYLRLEYSQDVFGQIGLPNVSVVARGKKVRDPRTGTTAWSKNPALCAADYLRDQTLGLRATAPQVPDAEIIEAADICDGLVDIDGVGTTQTRYACDAVLSTESGPRSNLSTITEAMAGTVVWVQGRWLVRAGAHRSASFTIDESMLAGGGCVVQPFSSLRDSVNKVIPTYAEAGIGFTEMQAPAVENALYLADDGGIEAPLEATYESCTDAIRAQRLAKIELERSRQALVVQVSCNLLAYDVAPTDVVALNITRYGWSGKLFEVNSRKLDLAAGTIDFVLRETAAGVWDWNHGDATAVDLTPNTDLPSPHTKPAALAALAVESGTDHLVVAGDGTVITRARVSWTQSTDVFVVEGGKIVVQWREAADADWQDVGPVPGAADSAFIAMLTDGVPIIVRVKPVNVLGRSGDWSVISHTVVGKTAPPSNVAGFAASVVPGAVLLTWDRPADLDWLETELRLGASWASSTLLYRGANTLYPWAWPAVGTYVVLAKHRDTSRNESAAVAEMPVTVNADGTISFGGVTWFTGGGLPATWGGVSSWTVPPVTHLVDTAELHLEAATTVITSFQLGPIDFSSGA